MRRVSRGAEGGNRSPFGEEESVGGDAQRGVMVKATPPSSLVMAEPKFLLEVLVVPLDPPAQLGGVHQARRLMFSGSVDRKYFVGSGSSAGHSIRHHSSGRGVER